MEESQQKPVNLHLQLQNLTNLQSRIQTTKKQLNLLRKIDHHQQKDMQNIMKMTFMTTRNKVNLFESHEFSHRKHNMQNQQLNKKRDMVRDMKAKEERQLRYIREQMKKNKENQRSLIRNNSLKYEQMIKMNRKHQLQKKQEMIKEIKIEKQRHRQQLQKSKIQSLKQKQLKRLNQTMAKIETQPSLKRQLQVLLKKKNDVETRINDKKNAKSKVLNQINDLKQLKSQQFVEAMRNSSISPQKVLRDGQFQISPSLINTLHQKSRLISGQK